MPTSYFINFTDPEKTPFGIAAFTSDGPRAPNTLNLSASAIAASTSLLLYGKGHAEYGERIQENLVNIMENFSGASEPTFPTSGQTWFARLTYVMTGLTTSPPTADFWRWDDVTETWILLTDVGSSDPVAADEIKTDGPQPLTVVDGSFWLNWVASPLYPELWLGVNNATSNLPASFILRELEDLADPVTGIADPNAEGYVPQKQLKVYDGLNWKNAAAVYTSAIRPSAPAQGDMWYDIGSPSLGLVIYDGTAWVAVNAGTVDLFVNTTGDTMTGDLNLNADLIMGGTGSPEIDMSGGFIINVSDPTDPQDVATKAYVDSLADLSLAANIETLAGGSPIEAKVNRSGDTMTGDLNLVADLVLSGTGNIVMAGSPSSFIDMGNKHIRFLLDPVLAQDAATKAYVDAFGGGGGGSPDGTVIAMNWMPTSRTLELVRSVGSPVTQLLFHNHPTGEVDHIVEGSALRELFLDSVFGSPVSVLVGSPVGQPLLASQMDINERLASLHSRRIDILEAPVAREVFVVGSPQAVFSFTEANYVAGTNALQVFVNGVKQYANERAYQKIVFNSGLDTSYSTPLYLPAGTYNLEIAVDGNAPSTVSGSEGDFLFVQDIINQINLDVPTVTAAWDAKATAIVIYSNTTGTGSEIEIFEGGSPASDLLVALTNPNLLGSPIASPQTSLYTLGNIVPAAGGPVSMIVQDFAYREVNDASPHTDAAFGDVAQTVLFGSPLTFGDVVEMLAFSR